MIKMISYYVLSTVAGSVENIKISRVLILPVTILWFNKKCKLLPPRPASNPGWGGAGRTVPRAPLAGRTVGPGGVAPPSPRSERTGSAAKKNFKNLKKKKKKRRRRSVSYRKRLPAAGPSTDPYPPAPAPWVGAPGSPHSWKVS